MTSRVTRGTSSATHSTRQQTPNGYYKYHTARASQSTITQDSPQDSCHDRTDQPLLSWTCSTASSRQDTVHFPRPNPYSTGEALCARLDACAFLDSATCEGGGAFGHTALKSSRAAFTALGFFVVALYFPSSAVSFSQSRYFGVFSTIPCWMTEWHMLTNESCGRARDGSSNNNTNRGREQEEWHCHCVHRHGQI